METEPTPADRRSARDVALTLLMWKAGLRVSEVVALDVSDVNLQSGQRSVVGGAVSSLPDDVYLAMNGRVFDPFKCRKNRDKRMFEEL